MILDSFGILPEVVTLELMSKIPSYKEIEPDSEGNKYVLLEPFTYWSPRYNKYISAEAGERSDGATGAIDIKSLAWWVHDLLCKRGTFDDGSPCTNWQASSVLSDILEAEGRWFRGIYWWASTWLLGGGEARKNGMW